MIWKVEQFHQVWLVKIFLISVIYALGKCLTFHDIMSPLETDQLNLFKKQNSFWD